MAQIPGKLTFTLDDIYQAGEVLIELKPDSIVAWRLLHDVFRLPDGEPRLVKAKNAAFSSKWVRQLEHVQLPNGSWGRFHSQDTKVKTVFRTTEEAIDRAMALGLDSGVGVLVQVRKYILEVMHGDARITDRDEKHATWPLGIRFILAGRLAQIDPANQILEQYWNYLSEVARQAFRSGIYRSEDEASAYLRLSGIHWPEGFLESQHALWILSSRKLSSDIEHRLIHWIWHKPDGIRYLRAPLSNFQSRRVAYWLRSMNILARFTAWRKLSIDILNQLWAQRDKDGCWDFGSQIARSVDFPLSESWRNPMSRRIDYTTCILILLRKYFDEA